jgi:hypothetical protein
MDSSNEPKPEEQQQPVTSELHDEPKSSEQPTTDTAPNQANASVTPSATPEQSTPSVSDSQPAAPAPDATTTVVSGGSQRRRFLSKPLIIGAGLVLLVAALAGAYFGYIVPNKPENVWNTALVNTGKIYDTLTDFATTQPKTETGSTVDGSYSFKGAIVSDGTFTGKSGNGDSQFVANISASGLKLALELRTIQSSAGSPDLYVKANGLKGLGELLGGGDPGVAQVFDGLNNQWYVVDHTLFDQLSGSKADVTMTDKDAKAFLAAVGDPSKEYLFTNDANKAVFVPKQTVPAETRDGRSVYHYKVGVNKSHLKTYLTTLCGKLKQDKIGKIVLEARPFSGQSCDTFAKRADKVKEGDTADVWVDRHTKLVHAVRFTDKQDANNFFELNQDYQSGSEYPFGLVIGSGSSDAATTVKIAGKLNRDTRVLTLKGDVASKGSKGTSGKFSVAVMPNKDAAFKVAQPQGAKSFAELLSDLGLDALLNPSNFTSDTT